MNSYVTLLSSESYFDGVIALNASLQSVGAKYPLYCLLSSNLDTCIQDKLKQYGVSCIRLDAPALSFSAGNDLKYSNWDYTFDKLKIWGLTQFDKIVFVDSDMIVVNNIDHLFEKPDFSAALAGVLFPSCEGLNFINSGIMVLTPSKQIELEMLDLAKTVVPEMRHAGKPVGDQDVINAYFPDWFDHKELILDDGYNLYSRYLQCYMRHHDYTIHGKGKKIYVIHYVGTVKPWMINTCWKFFKMCVNWFPNIYYAWSVVLHKRILGNAIGNQNVNYDRAKKIY